MKTGKLLIFLSILYICGCSTQTITSNQTPQIIYNINVQNSEDDLFHVTVLTSHLTEKNGIYNFAATAPGTYHQLDFGRFVKTFKAFDENGNELPTKNISTNMWEIEDVLRLSKIEYDIEDTFDSEIKKNQPAPMCGSGIDEDFIAINTFAILGYFEGLQSFPVKLKVEYNSDWIIGTSLISDENGYYTADTYDRLADSPILMGELTVATTKVGEIGVEVYVFAIDTALYAQKILILADDVLQSSKGFVGYAPVENYKFLMLLLSEEYYDTNELMGGGALEHSYSSLYVQSATENDLPRLRSTMAHEFMHILTPINLCSEIIHNYNFAVPTASEHIWLYEGVTEWVSDIMQLRSGLITTEEYLNQFSRKLRINDGFDPNISLSKMSLEVYIDSVKPLFFNFYNRGAATAALLDIRLLELSNGKRGLREVYLTLLERYGKDRPFPEDKFLDIFVEMTYPEIEDFINNYIRGSKPLPFVEYMAMLGFSYTKENFSKDTRPTIGINISENEEGELFLISVNNDAQKFGLTAGDILIKVFGEEINIKTAREVLLKLDDMGVGDPYEMVVRRGEKEITLTGELLQRKTRHIFEEMEELTPKQQTMRESWVKNLDR